MTAPAAVVPRPAARAGRSRTVRLVREASAGVAV